MRLPCQAWPAALPHLSCWGCGYWCLGLFFGVRMVPWPLVHSPSFLQAPTCLVITLGRWTVARLPWWPPCCWGECCLLPCYLYDTYPPKYWRGFLNEAKYNLGKVKTKPMQRCCLGYLRGIQGGLQGHCHVLWLELLFRLLASLPSLPPIF